MLRYVYYQRIILITLNNLDKYTPAVFDTLITDISADTLKSDVSELLKQKYLAPLE